MATEIENRVLMTLSAVEVPPGVAQVIESWGNEAVTVTCGVALGDYPGAERRVRANAVALLGWMSHPQALETVPLLLTDPNPNIAARAFRAASRHADPATVAVIAGLLRRRDLSPILAAEAVDALATIDSSEARDVLRAYQTSGNELPHRRSQIVETHLTRRTNQ